MRQSSNKTLTSGRLRTSQAEQKTKDPRQLKGAVLPEATRQGGPVKGGDAPPGSTHAPVRQSDKRRDTAPLPAWNPRLCIKPTATHQRRSSGDSQQQQ